MTAPAAPVILCHTDGDKVYVRWQPVANAINYNLYVGDTIDPTGLEDTIPEADIESDGWFQYVFMGAGVMYLRLTALNSLDEESDYSNEKHMVLVGPGRSFGRIDHLFD